MVPYETLSKFNFCHWEEPQNAKCISLTALQNIHYRPNPLVPMTNLYLDSKTSRGNFSRIRLF